MVLLSGTGQVELRTGHFGLEVDMMGVVVFPPLFPETFNFPHLHLSIDASRQPTSIKLSNLFLQAISLYKTL